MQLTVHSAGSLVVVQVDPATPIGIIMDQIWAQERIPVDKQKWTVSTENALCVDTTPDFEFNAYEDKNESDSTEDENEWTEGEEGEEKIGRSWTFEEKKRCVDYYNATPNRTFKSVRRQWSSLSQAQFSRFKKQVANGGTKWDKLQQVDGAVMAKVIEARSNFQPVHESNLANWGSRKPMKLVFNLQPAVTVFTSLRNDTIWCQERLPRCYRSQNWPTRRKLKQLLLRNEFLGESLTYSPELIFNTDQSGFQHDIYSRRTLSFRGEKDTLIAVKSMNKATPTYTVQPTLGYDGKVYGPLYLCLQEVGGQMGVRVKETYFRAQNVEVTCSQSGKLTTSLFERYVDYVMAPLVKGDCLLLLDLWAGQQTDDCFQSLEQYGFTCTRLRIPEGATPTTQPLDTTWNRQYKGIVTLFYEYVSTNGIQINLYQRDNIIKLHSLIYHQFEHSRFVPMGKYAWYTSGLSFETAKEILFHGIYCNVHLQIVIKAVLFVARIAVLYYVLLISLSIITIICHFNNNLTRGFDWL